MRGKKNHVEAANILISGGADVNAHDETRMGDTAITYAVENEDYKMVSLLLSAGADPTIPGIWEIQH